MGKRFILFTYIIALLLFAGSPDTAIITTDTTDIEDPSAMQVASLAASDYGTVYFSKGNGQKRAVCLTFDDGPDKVVTTKIINILNKYDV
ncbi:MAG: polysaccharide deacetylase family protein, partial [Firmicutes bacterium]|nr:polysaccharide deacetylase family protein [Bacillota bacterium]